MNNELFAIGRDTEGNCHIAICIDEMDCQLWGIKNDLIVSFHTERENIDAIKDRLNNQINGLAKVRTPIAVNDSFALYYGEATAIAELLENIDKYSAPIEWTAVSD